SLTTSPKITGPERTGAAAPILRVPVLRRYRCCYNGRRTDFRHLFFLENRMLLADVELDYGTGWGTLALINAGLAQGKGRRGLVWFLISLLRGPVAMFLLLVLGRLEAL